MYYKLLLLVCVVAGVSSSIIWRNMCYHNSIQMQLMLHGGALILNTFHFCNHIHYGISTTLPQSNETLFISDYSQYKNENSTKLHIQLTSSICIILTSLDTTPNPSECLQSIIWPYKMAYYVRNDNGSFYMHLDQTVAALIRAYDN